MSIKLGRDLLRGIRSIKPPSQSISSWVRETLEHEIRQHRMLDAARSYQTLMKESREEAAGIEEWEAAPLGRVPRARRR